MIMIVGFCQRSANNETYLSQSLLLVKTDFDGCFNMFALTQ